MPTPLPAIPPPPCFGPDARQETFYRTVRQLTERPPEDGEVRVAATDTGYPASAVDLARLQAEIERGLADLSMAEIRSRWTEEILPWLAAFTRAWVQRRKALHADPRGRGIAVRIETQDDFGYYTYAFDIFPGRMLQVKAARTGGEGR